MVVSREFLLPSIKFLSRGLINLVFSKIIIKNFVAITSQMEFLIIIHDVAFRSLHIWVTEYLLFYICQFIERYYRYLYIMQQTVIPIQDNRALFKDK